MIKLADKLLTSLLCRMQVLTNRFICVVFKVTVLSDCTITGISTYRYVVGPPGLLLHKDIRYLVLYRYILVLQSAPDSTIVYIWNCNVHNNICVTQGHLCMHACMHACIYIYGMQYNIILILEQHLKELYNTYFTIVYNECYITYTYFNLNF